ncbi:adenylate/guanylate cyclase domain-containing protein [Ilumatobacter coccineus]|uniref:adenylate/guanylate cyclase domain-containing protein n=1 Tax=Ilumatobacter coccineus TaxID=467094 RepID=UPI00138B0DAA|nr:adenylate/guanylate cyclase domain-containing protein [Ilumatobacter coccineus]
MFDLEVRAVVVHYGHRATACTTTRRPALTSRPACASQATDSTTTFYAETVHPVVEIRQPNQPTLFISIRGPLEVGRECNGVLLADPQVSRRHLSIDVDAGRVIVSDLGSTNGSTLDGNRLVAPSVLGPGSEVKCGETTIRLDAPVAAVKPVDDAKGTVVSGADLDPTGTIVATPPTVTPNAPDPLLVAQRPIAGGDEAVYRTSIDMVAESAQSDGVDVRALPADQGTVTIVFSDIESSTERNVQLGDQVWMQVLGDHNRIVTDRVNQYGGTIIKNQGDGYMLSFSGARVALDCMMAVQRDLTAHASANPDRSVRIRIGMHTGEVLADQDGDLFGTHVVVAARVANLAQGGEILVSSLTKEIIASRGDITFDPPRNVHLKGIGDAVVYPMDWARHG